MLIDTGASVVALTGAAVLLLLGVVRPVEVQGAFASPALIALASLFVIAYAMERSGLLDLAILVVALFMLPLVSFFQPVLPIDAARRGGGHHARIAAESGQVVAEAVPCGLVVDEVMGAGWR